MEDLPFLTKEIPGTGGAIKQIPEDFIVEEQLSFPLSGSGEHLYVQIEKKNLTTMEVVNLFCKSSGVKKADIGYAGMKDARAITRQFFSIRGICENHLESISKIKNIRILSTNLHQKKLKLGQIRGNKFCVVIRDINSQSTTEKTLRILQKMGVPNYFGWQRFGNNQNTHLLGKYLLLKKPEQLTTELFSPSVNDHTKLALAKEHFAEGRYREAYEAMPRTYEAEKIVLSSLARGKDAAYSIERIPRRTKYFYVCAYQSYLFNLSLAKRLPLIDKLLCGDLAVLHPSRSVFTVEDVEKEQPRALQNKISPSGPMYGYKMTSPKGKQQQLEQEILREEQLDTELFRQYKVKGERRSYRFFLSDVEVHHEQHQIKLQFFLAKGCYATMVLRELMKIR